MSRVSTLVLLISTVRSLPVTWKLMTREVVMGYDIELFCNESLLNDCCPENMARRWFGGPNQQLLALDGVSSNRSKYVSHVKHNGFNLIIRNVEEKDLNVSYTCNVGFNKYKNILIPYHISTKQVDSSRSYTKSREETDKETTIIVIVIIVGFVVLFLVVITLLCWYRIRKKSNLNTGLTSIGDNKERHELVYIECSDSNLQENVTSASRGENGELLTSGVDQSTTGGESTELLTSNVYHSAYTAVDDMVRCFYCSGGINDWHENDDPWIAHARWFPECEFLIKQKGVEFLKSVQSIHKENVAAGSGYAREAVYPQYDTFQSRYNSLRNWSARDVVCIDSVAKAGFFYQHQDQVYCFYCGIGLHGWTEDDDPFEKHKDEYPYCAYVRSEEFKRNNHNFKETVIQNEASSTETQVTTPKSVIQSSASSTEVLSLEDETNPKEKYPNFSSVDSRIDTFSKWSSSRLPNPDNMAKAGFFVIW